MIIMRPILSRKETLMFRRLKDLLTLLALATVGYQTARGFGSLAREVYRERKLKKLNQK